MTFSALPRLPFFSPRSSGARGVQLPPGAHRWLARFLALALGLGGIWLLQLQLWQFLTPRGLPAPPLPESPSATAAQLAGLHLFGLAAQPRPTQAESQEFRLVGLIAASGDKPGAALLLRQGESRPLVVANGASPAPGLVLQRMEPRAVWLSRDGVETRLALPEPSFPRSRK